jgi:uncharacterized protein YndB with AHSA1/START domain
VICNLLVALIRAARYKRGKEIAMTTSDQIRKQIHLKAPVSRVWRALTDAEQFGQWFRVRLESPFAAGQHSAGHILHPGYEHLRMTVLVEAIEPETRFALRWHPYAIDPAVDYSSEPTTLVEFTLAPEAGGTLLTLTESGFDRLPASRRDEAWRMNDGGWAAQMDNIRAHVES